jgi:hypothetical protein
MRKLRMKGWDEGGHKKRGKSTNEGEGEKGWVRLNVIIIVYQQTQRDRR